MKRKTNIHTKDSAGININPQIECGPFKGYISGELLDANAVSALIDQKINVVIGGATTAGDTLKEIEDKIDALAMSQITNDAGYVQQDENGQLKVNETNITNTINKIVVSNQPFPASWPKSGQNKGFSDLIAAMNNTEDVTAGKVYLATVYYNDLPDSMMLAELKIEIMQWDDIRHIAVFTLSSSDRPPYNWHNTLLDDQLGSWYSYALVETEPGL